MRQNGVRSNVRFPYGKGGSSKKKKQGYAAREDESLGMRTGKESGKKQSFKARRDESYGAWGKRSKRAPERVNKANLGALMMKKAHSKGAKGAELLSPVAMLKRMAGKRKGGSIKGGNRPRPQGPHMWVREKGKKYRKGGHTNTRRENRLEELGRVDAEKGYTRTGKRNLQDEKRRIVRELKK